MGRINLSDSKVDAVIIMSEGNPGAMNALMEILAQARTVSPGDGLAGIGAILMLDSLRIYGTSIYVLYSDICGKDVDKTLAVIRATQLGFFDGGKLQHACGRQDYSGRDMVPVDELYLKMKNHDETQRFLAANQ